jgi:hypothetical protein
VNLFVSTTRDLSTRISPTAVGKRLVKLLVVRLSSVSSGDSLLMSSARTQCNVGVVQKLKLGAAVERSARKGAGEVVQREVKVHQPL